MFIAAIPIQHLQHLFQILLIGYTAFVAPPEQEEFYIYTIANKLKNNILNFGFESQHLSFRKNIFGVL